MFDIRLRCADRTRRYSIAPRSQAGWEVKLEEDCELTHYVCYHDWHRVERAVASFELEVSRLTASGWRREA